MESTYKQIERQILESIPTGFDDRDVLEVLEHVQTMLDVWTDFIKERISDTYV